MAKAYEDLATSLASLADSLSPKPVGLPFKALPLELLIMIRKLLGPMDILNCGLVCKEWRTCIYSPDSLFDLLYNYQSHSADDSASIWLCQTKLIMLHAVKSGLDPAIAEVKFQGYLDKAIQVMKAHQWGVPAKACRAIEGASSWDGLSCLAGQYLLRQTRRDQLELLDLVRHKRYTTIADLPTTISCAALTSMCFAYCFRGYIVHEVLKDFEDPLLLEWDDTEFDLLTDIEDIGGEMFNMIAVRSVRCHEETGLGLMRIDVQENTKGFAFVPAPAHDAIAVIPDGEGCAIFVAYLMPHLRVKLLRMATLRSKPVESVLDLDVYGDDWKFEVRRIGYRRHVQLSVAGMHFVVGLDDGAFTPTGQSDIGRWKESLFAAEDRRVEVRDMKGEMKSAFSHSEWYECPDSLVLVNESFLVGVHPAHASCPGYNAYCFDDSLPIMELSMEGLERYRRPFESSLEASGELK